MNKKVLALIGITLIGFVAFLEYTIVNTSLPTIQKQFNVSVLELQWVFNIYSIILALFMIIGGRLGDIYGRRKVLYYGTLLLLLGSIGAGLAWSFGWLIFFRAVQSIGVAGIVTLAPSLMHSIFEDKVHHAISFYASVTGIAVSIGPTIGGIIVMHANWHWIFLINIPLLLIAFACCLPTVSEYKATEKTKLDIWGALFLTLTLVPFIYAVIQGAQIGWFNPIIIACFIVTIIALPLLIKVENAHEQPILNFHFFTKPIFILSVISFCAVSLLLTSSIFFSPLLLQEAMGYTPKQAGLILLAVPITLAIFAPLIGGVIKKLGEKTTLILGPVIALVSIIFHIIFADSGMLAIGVVGFLLVGVSWAICNVAGTIGAASPFKREQAGVAMGTAFSMFNIMAALSLTITTLIFESASSAKATDKASAYIAGYHAVFVFALLATLVLLIIGGMSLYRSRKTTIIT